MTKNKVGAAADQRAAVAADPRAGAAEVAADCIAVGVAIGKDPVLVPCCCLG